MRTRQREKNPTCACISDDIWAHGDLVASHRGMTSSPKSEPRSPDQTIKPSKRCEQSKLGVKFHVTVFGGGRRNVLTFSV
ncbi:uncharacterized protein EAE97_005057 [Botrytis byssoidea]|uniref:Uncharacterized protein n=1 Tax=Botrytis byssoidea TaxID=139641 RepID=A0A9P5IS24_9HELO|nr:uncharacterized protein EAE97_005057 [Botrytis byssoidea]KAF7946019.1 hypothetical protein EAE97_005057 [Botrytis byssoidea]